jgi:zinc protease
VRVIVFCALVLVGALASPAQTAEGVLEATLGNGLRVLLLEDHRSPVVSFQVWYRVGSRNELPGATGIAHFLEHMMFKGTPTYARGRFSQVVEQSGGRDNAFTSQDVTSYFVDISVDKLDGILELEADRMHNLLLAPEEITSERQVVMEERRTRTEDDPGGALGEEISSVAFQAHPYGAPVIGRMVDLERITPAEITAFYRTYYVPNNAIVTAVGDFDAPELLRRIERAFGPIPRGPDPPKVLAIEPPQTGERRVTVTREAQLPVVYIAYHVPNNRSEDAPALELLSAVLAGGRASRIYRHLIVERQLALNAGGDYSYFSLDPNLFWFWATPLPGQTPAALEESLLDEMRQLQRAPVSEEELARAKNQLEAGFVFQQDSVHSRATVLARFELIGGYRLQDQFLPRIRAVTAADLMRVANAYFAGNGKNVGILIPKSPDGARAGDQPR